MNVIVCVDDRGGTMFNNRRQSRDRNMIMHMLRLVGDRQLYVREYSRSLFEQMPKMPQVREDMLDAAGAGEFCFCEDGEVARYISRIEKIVLYRWNRTYPFDRRFDVEPAACGFKMTATEDFEGYSHEKITMEVYER